MDNSKIAKAIFAADKEIYLQDIRTSETYKIESLILAEHLLETQDRVFYRVRKDGKSAEVVGPFAFFEGE